MLKEVSDSGRCISSGDEIFRKYFPNYPGLVDDLSVKQDIKQLAKMIEILDSQSIVGWLSSLEDKKELEIFVIGNNQMLENLIEPISLTEEYYRYYNALNFITLKPSSTNPYKKKGDIDVKVNVCNTASRSRAYVKVLCRLICKCPILDSPIKYLVILMLLL